MALTKHDKLATSSNSYQAAHLNGAGHWHWHLSHPLITDQNRSYITLVMSITVAVSADIKQQQGDIVQICCYFEL